MGTMRFLVHLPEMLGNGSGVYRAYLSGAEGRVFPTTIEREENVIVCRRERSESGKLHIEWPIPAAGQLVVSTTTLPERDEPYLLSVELARGLISRVRDQASSWQIAGMTIPDEFGPLDAEAHRCLVRAIAGNLNPEEACRLADRALEQAHQAGEIITRAYVRQRKAARRRRSSGMPALLGCRLDAAIPGSHAEAQFRSVFNAAEVPTSWREIEHDAGERRWESTDAAVDWCHDQGLFALAGPLLDLSTAGLPGWLSDWDKDFANLQSFVCDFVETAVSRYSGRIRHWEIAASASTGGALALNEEQRLELTAHALEVARHIDDENQLILRIDQPWGEYQARGQHRLAPMQFVDALLRSGVGLSAVNLEIIVGCRPRGTAPRSLLEFSRLIDRWSCLGVPLYATFGCPSATGDDPQAHPDLDVERTLPDGWSGETVQAEWIERLLPLVMAKDAVVGLFWTHFSDRHPHTFPHAGLIRPDGTPKPAWERIRRHPSPG